MRYDLNLSFEQAAFGAETKVDLEKSEICATCEGRGAKPGTHPETCPQCRGTGQVGRSQGFFTIRTTCHQCRGAGQIIAQPCPDCHGRGQVRVKKTVSVKIPAGVDNGSRLRLSGEGEAGGQGGQPGDLYVFIHVEPHHFFKRDDTEVICQIPISFIQAALGDTIQVPTLEEEEKLEIPKGTQFGDVFRLAGKGIPSLRNGRRGDQIVQVTIKTPTHLNKKQEDLLKEFAKLEESKLGKRLKNFLKNGTSRAN